MPNLACGRVPSHACNVCACFNAGFIGSGWAWHLRAHVGPTTVTCDRWACPPSGVTSDPCQVPWWAWQEVKGEAMAVNEADYTSVIVRTVGPEERQRRCEVGVVVSRWCCSAHTGNEVSSCVGGVVEQS